MARSKSSKKWLREHFEDEYVKRARAEGFRSRSVYKLIEIHKRYKLLRPGIRVVELGAAPGGWSQYTASVIGTGGMLIAVDLLAMDPVPGVSFIHGDFTEMETLEKILDSLGGDRVDLVMSDMSPNISGMASIDQPKAMYLAELAFDLAEKVLGESGVFLVKLFQGEGFDSFVELVRRQSAKVQFVKPKASRPRSREVYLLATGFRPTLI